MGKLTYFRVYSGTLKAGSYVYNSSKDKRERISRILQMHANHREDRDEIYAGEIAAAVGLKVTGTGDTLCDPAKPVILESMEFPEPVIFVAIEPKTKADEEKLGNSLQRLAEEDPTFRVRTDEETGQTIIAGMGELHLEIIVDRLLREFGVDANVGRPQVAYRETITQQGRQGRGQVRPPDRRPRPVRSRASSTWSPTTPGGGYEFESKIVGGVVPRDYIPVGRRRHPGGHGAPACSPAIPMVDIKVALIDGSYHEVDSSDMAFKIAGSLAFKNAAQKAKPVLLEPMMAVEVVTPADFMGDVMGDLNSRRGHIDGMEPRGNAQVINATVPLVARCSATPPTCARRRRVAPRTPCSSSTTPRCPAAIAQEIVTKVRGG